MLRAVLTAFALAATVAACTSPSEPDPRASGTASPTPTPTATATGGTGVRTIEIRNGNQHTTNRVAYPQTPPAGGPHFPNWLRCDAYDEPVPNEAAVHSLEHGAVWVTYARDLTPAEVATLRELRDVNREHVLISPYDGLPGRIVATAWGLQLTTDRADDPRLRRFVRQYAGGDQGGEPGATCATGGVTPEQVSARLAGQPVQSAR